ncbi:histone lysine N methyltransferase MLL3 [Echinococcus multilocularis]|uniref:Histone lysine N methyltransferase MLL3 n=1 Tax=Echinococcus multilocularis TaxID=6211 RepID=A0A068YIU6_ECHMU|nr:histone lysine N methyltransferase MLL3 [Echinococcus multilocularis]
MESKTNEAHLFLSGVSGVSNPQARALFATCHATHSQIPVSLPANHNVDGDNYNNCSIRPTVPSCKRKLSSSPPATNDRTMEGFSNGSPTASKCCVQPSPAKRVCQNSSQPEAQMIAATVSSIAPSQAATLALVNNVQSVQASGDAVSAVAAELAPPQPPVASDFDRLNSGKLEQVIEHVLELARSDEPHEDVFVLPVRTREFIPMPSPINQGSTPSSSLNTSPPGSPSSSPRLISPAFSNSTVSSNPMVITAHTFPRCTPVDQVPSGIPLHQCSAPTAPPAALTDLQREKLRLQAVRESNVQVSGTNAPPTVTMLMKTTATADSLETSFMQSKGITQSGYFDSSGANIQSQGCVPRQILSKVSMAVTETKILPVQQTEMQKQQINQQNQNLQPRLFAYIPQRQIYDSANSVFTVPTSVQPRPNISPQLAVKKDSTVEFTNQINFPPHGTATSNGVTQVVPSVKQPGLTPVHTMQYSDSSPKSALGTVPARKRPPSSSKRKKSAPGHQNIPQGTKVSIPAGPMTFVRNPLVAPQGMEFAQQVQPPLRQPTASQEAMNKLVYFDSKKFLSDPTLEAFASALSPMGSPTCSTLQLGDESWLTNCGIKYRCSGLALKAVCPSDIGDTPAELSDLYLYQFLPQALTYPTVQRATHIAKTPEIPSRICVSPEPVTLDNRMRSFWTTLRHSESPGATDTGSVVDSNDSCSILLMLKTPCSPCEGPTESRTPPLQLYHIPNTCLLKATQPSHRSSNATDASSIDSVIGESAGSSYEKLSSLSHEVKPDSRIVFGVSSSHFGDVPRLLQYLCDQVGISQSYVTYSKGEISIQNPEGSSHSEDRLREFGNQLKIYFSHVSVRVEPLESIGAKAEESSDISSQIKFFAELQKEKADDLMQTSMTSKHREEVLSVASIASSKRLTGERCRICHSLVPRDSGLRRKLDELVPIPPVLTVDHGYHASDCFVFCSEMCLNKFVDFISSHSPSAHVTQVNSNALEQAVSVTESRQHPQQLVFGSVPGSIPVLLQHLPHKSLKSQAGGRRSSSLSMGKRKVSPKQKRWRDVRWRIYKSDVYHARKFANVSHTLIEGESKTPRLLCTVIRDPEIPDTRSCILCGAKGDGSVSTTERLLCLGPDRWVHLNCALWCYDIYESVSGSLHRVDESIERALKTSCSHCGKLGAGLPCYNPRCSLVYHVPCAISVGCMFFTDRGMYCTSHQPRDSHPMQLTSLVVNRKVYVTRDESSQVADVVRDETHAYRIRIGSLILNSVGQLLPRQIESRHFHTQKYIYPVHYSSTRIYWSMRRPGQRALYHCKIKEQEGRPLFQVTAVDKGLPDVVLQNVSCNDLWKGIATKIQQLRRENGLIQNFPDLICGEDMFGLSEPHIVRAIESLPGVDNLVDYAFHFGRLQLIKGMPLAVNPSGCARSEPSFLTSLRRRRACAGSHEKSPMKSVCCQFRNLGRQSSGIFPITSLPSASEPWSRISIDLTMPKNSTLVSWSHQYRRLRSEFHNNVAFGRSRIQGFGLFAAQDLEPNTIVIEYIGELIRLELANKREKEYEARNRGIYMFRLEDNMVIDATMCGGLARYVNHSCQPNCFTKYVNFDNEGHIVIITKRKIEKGEELTYDYQFDFEDRTSKIPCLCGAVGCRKWMN